MSRSIAWYWLCFLFLFEGLLFVERVRVMRGRGYGQVCAGVLVRLLMKMDGLSHYGCTFFCEVDGRRWSELR
jgi:hypothetical protein